MQEYLQGLDWPADKETVVESARGNGAPKDTLEQMRKSPSGRSFSGPEEVAENLQR